MRGPENKPDIKQMMEEITRDAVLMCYMGKERSVAMQAVFADAGFYVEVFSEGTRRLCRMTREQIEAELKGKRVYLIYEQGSKNIEKQTKDCAVEMLVQAQIQYQVVDTSYLKGLANTLGRNYDDFLLSI